MLIMACRSHEADDEAIRRAVDALPPPPTALREGEALFAANCARCHGRAGGGSPLGPPLAHRVYEPSHHADAAFHLAVRRGVVAHHWRFGDMPAQPQLTDEQVTQIVAYVRWVQRGVGVGID